MRKTKAGKLVHAFRFLTKSNEEKKDVLKKIKTKDLTDFKCTKCGENFQKLIDKGEEIPVHPMLGVLFCNKCCSFYGNGEFSVDSDEEEKYCRWCGEGGTLFECSKCICHFCPKCIKRNLGADALNQVERDDDWKCYICDIKPLWVLRHVALIAEEKSALNRNKKKEERQSKLVDLQKKISGKCENNFIMFSK